MENQQMAEEMERVTDPAAPDPVPETTKNKRAKDPKKVTAGRAGAAAWKAKMLEALRAVKESLCSSAVPHVGKASIPPKEAESKDQEHADKWPDVPVALQQPEYICEGRTNWTTWTLAACLVGALIVSQLQQTKCPASVVAGPAMCPQWLTLVAAADNLDASVFEPVEEGLQNGQGHGADLVRDDHPRDELLAHFSGVHSVWPLQRKKLL